MISRVAQVARWWLVAAVSVGVGACVNEYLHGEGGTTSVATSSTSSTGSTSSTAGGTATTGAATGTATSDGEGSTTGGGTEGASSTAGTTASSTPGEGDPSGTSDGGTLELCQGPCTTDTECGGDPDLCVELTRGAEPVCLRRCGRGCLPGYTCVERTSIDGASGMQCQPDGNECS